jgi:hypothetical protein
VTEQLGTTAPKSFALGRRPPSNKRALEFGSIWTGTIPATQDNLEGPTFGLYGNDRFGVCGPTYVANLVRLVSKWLVGTQIEPSQDDVFELYRRSGNPDFDPNTGAGDSGVDMQTMLEALLKYGIGDGKGGVVKPLAFAKLNVRDENALRAAVAIFGGCGWGVDLELAQQDQSVPGGTWDYKRSGDWGGHAILNGAYEQALIDDVITWAMRVKSTQAFRSKQLEEAWVVIWPWNLGTAQFQQGIDQDALQQQYHNLTGKTLPSDLFPPAPVPPIPDPDPNPTPIPPAPVDPPTPEPIPAPPTPNPAPGGGGDSGGFLDSAVEAHASAVARRRGMTLKEYVNRLLRSDFHMK